MVAANFAFGANAHMQDARKSPEWFTRGVMYQIQPRAFTPEGTLKAAAEKLPYLKDLGVTIAYLVPVMKMDTDMDKGFWSPRQIKSGFDNPKNQYRISDYFHVDEEYGTDADLRDLHGQEGSVAVPEAQLCRAEAARIPDWQYSVFDEGVRGGRFPLRRRRRHPARFLVRCA